MGERSCWETVKLEGGQLVDKLKTILHEGNVRRIVVRQGERLVAEFPLTVGVVGAVISPVLAAVGALAALLSDCSIEIEREALPPSPPSPPATSPPAQAS